MASQHGGMLPAWSQQQQHQNQQQQLQQQRDEVAGVHQAATVTLGAPRPDVARTANEYVETPLRPPSEVVVQCARTRGPVVTKQPGPGSGSGPKKDRGSSGVAVVSPASRLPPQQCSIICRECGRCRCDACRLPRPTPSLWLCDNLCYCSLDSCVDYCSCLCCVKGLMYHCATRDRDDDTLADDPCSCSDPHRRTARWTCLALTSLLLPCLCCYWPLRGAATLCDQCYARCTSNGCRCSPASLPHSQHTDLPTPQKRLLDSTPEY